MPNKLNHISFIMDGNTRWAKKNNQNLYDSYNKGSLKLLNLTEYLFKSYDMSFVSSFALSSHNLKRSAKTISILKKVLNDFLDSNINGDKYKFNIKFIGDLTFLNSSLFAKLKNLEAKKQNFNKSLIIFINYSGRQDIINSINSQKKNDLIKKDNLNYFLSTKDFPNPDLIIRTGGFQRISDFMLFQIAFSELIFTKKLWPDISNSDLKSMIKKYHDTERKFGI
ncbi:polyprenyl diphosphate synthase [Alphaproteobacteria bacterium]|nr:polyprenyl diphosphate synthase [Alphaproteobacteria bacterium]